jgi:hypothetical protein
LGKAKEVREGHVRNIFIVHVRVLWHDKSRFAVQKYEKHWGMESGKRCKIRSRSNIYKRHVKKNSRLCLMDF